MRYKYADEAQKAVERLDGMLISSLSLLYLFSIENCVTVFCLLTRACQLYFSGRVVGGREITVQFAKYGPNAERM